MSKLPEKGELIRFDHLKIKRNAFKHCTCEAASFEVDVENSLVNCMNCGALIEPFQALLKMSKHAEKHNANSDAYWDQTMAMKEEYLSYQKKAAQAKLDLDYFRAEYAELERKTELLTADLSRIKHKQN